MVTPWWNEPEYGPWPSVDDEDLPIRRPMPETRGTEWWRLPKEEQERAIFDLAKECDVPTLAAESLAAYILTGRMVGHFLQAVLTNDLKEACVRADEVNKHHIWDIVFFLYNHAPLKCWGSTEKYAEWLMHRGLAEYVEPDKNVPRTG